MRANHWRLIVAVLAAGAVLTAVGCSASKSGGAAAARGTDPAGARKFGAVPVQAITVKLGVLTASNETSATVVAVTQSTVASQVAGVVARVQHVAGDWVKVGEPVAVLDTSQLKLAVATAEAALENAKINYQVGQDNANADAPKLLLQVESAQSALQSAQKSYDSQKAVFDIGGASASAVDSANAQLQQAQANLKAAQTALEQNKKSDVWAVQQLRLAVDQTQLQLQQAQLNLSYASISAPFAGQIVAVNVNPGVYVSQNTAVFVIVSAEKEINFSVPPADTQSLPVGTAVQFEYMSKSYTVRISQAPSAPVSGVVPMVAAVPRSVPLPYGAVGTVSYGLTVAHGAIVPMASLESSEDQNYVFVVSNGKAAVRPVKIVGQSETSAAVDGVPDGAQVITNAPPGLLDGTAVQVISNMAAQGATGTQSADQPGTSAARTGLAGQSSRP